MLAAARERDINDMTGREIVVELKKVPFNEAKEIVESICLRERFPGNLYAAVRNERTDRERRRNQQIYARESWKVKNEDMVSPEEWKSFWQMMKQKIRQL